MTLYEARRIAAIAATADNGCGECVKDIVLQLNEQFPEFKWEMVDWYGPEQSVFVEYR
jgi:hypothetical protein